MNLSKELQDHKAKYEAKYKKPAFEKGQPTIEFAESIIRVMNFHYKKFCEVEIYRSTTMLEIKAELIK